MAKTLLDFALATEGVTDQAVLENILVGFFKDSQRVPSLTNDHPVRSKSKKYGGWTLLLKYLHNGDYKIAFQFSQYVIVHVDTDTADEPGFDVARHDAKGALPLEVFLGKVVERLKAEINEEDLKTYDGRFIFAVSVEQIECWMLPLWFDDANAERTGGCFERLGKSSRLRSELKKKKQAFFKHPQLYQSLSFEYRKRNTLLEKGPRNPSLKIFLEALEARQIVLPPVD